MADAEPLRGGQERATPAGQPSPYSEAERTITLAPGQAGVTLTAPACRGLLRDLATLRGAADILAPGQTPSLDRLEEILVAQYRDLTGITLAFSPADLARAQKEVRRDRSRPKRAL